MPAHAYTRSQTYSVSERTRASLYIGIYVYKCIVYVEENRNTYNTFYWGRRCDAYILGNRISSVNSIRSDATSIQEIHIETSTHAHIKDNVNRFVFDLPISVSLLYIYVSVSLHTVFVYVYWPVHVKRMDGTCAVWASTGDYTCSIELYTQLSSLFVCVCILNISRKETKQATCLLSMCILYKISCFTGVCACTCVCEHMSKRESNIFSFVDMRGREQICVCVW